MRSSRTPHTLSRMSCESRRTHSGSSKDSLTSVQKPTSKMKFIIVVGIALPIIAAVIGVVAWAVSADAAFRTPLPSSLRRADSTPHEEDIFQLLEDRHELSYSPPRADSAEMSQPPSRVDARGFDDLPGPPAPRDKDPLYIVHFVPTGKPKPSTETSSEVPDEVLKKILSASKGAKPGTPQFVVFAPIPGEEDRKTKINDLSGIGTSVVSTMSKLDQTTGKDIDYDYEEELRKYQEILNSKGDQKETSRTGSTTDISNGHQGQIRKETFHVVSRNVSSGTVYHNQPIQINQVPSPQMQDNQLAGPNTNYPPDGFHQLQQEFQNSYPGQQLQPPETQQFHPEQVRQFHQIQPGQQIQQVHPLQPKHPATQQFRPEHQVHQSHQIQPGQQIHPPQQTHPETQQFRPEQQIQPGQQIHPPQQKHPETQQFRPEQHLYNSQQVHPGQQVSQHIPAENHAGIQPAATDRSGYAEPVGIKLSLGNGGGPGLLGGGYSPLGVISSILPIIRRPRVNLNGKVMFGVMLEKGVKFGEDKKLPQFG